MYYTSVKIILGSRCLRLNSVRFPFNTTCVFQLWYRLHPYVRWSSKLDRIAGFKRPICCISRVIDFVLDNFPFIFEKIKRPCLLVFPYAIGFPSSITQPTHVIGSYASTATSPSTIYLKCFFIVFDGNNRSIV